MRPEAIFARRTRFAYGVSSLETFRPGLPERLKTYEPSVDKTYCKNFFTRFIGQDALVEHDQVGIRPVPGVDVLVVWGYLYCNWGNVTISSYKKRFCCSRNIWLPAFAMSTCVRILFLHQHLHGRSCWSHTIINALQVIKHQLYCIKKNQTGTTFAIYQCINNSDLFTDLPSMTEIQSFTIDIPNPSVVDDKYGFSVSFTFGTTELTVSAIDDQTGRQATVSVAFSAE